MKGLSRKAESLFYSGVFSLLTTFVTKLTKFVILCPFEILVATYQMSAISLIRLR
jgi:hypothetical protein